MLLPSVSLTLCLSLSCAYASFSVSLGLPISLSLPLCSLPVPTFCLPMSPHVPSSPSLSLFLPSTANLETCLHLSCVFFSLSLSISDLCLGLLCVPPSQGISLPSPVHPGSRPQPRAWGSSLSGPARSSAGPFVHCPTLQALLSLPPSQAPKLGRALQPKMWKNVVLSLGLRHQEAQDGCQSWTTPTQPLGPLGRQPPPPLSPSPSP